MLDRRLIEKSQASIETGAKVTIEEAISNTDRTTGAMLSGRIAIKHGETGLPDDTIVVKLKGTAGQSFGGFLAKGVTLELEGQATIMSARVCRAVRIIVKPPANTGVVPEASIIIGNTALYGATDGESFFRGVAGERFGVRNSGAVSVVEGTGDHGCEYMTGGVVVVLGMTGRNFAAGHVGRRRLRLRRGWHVREAVQHGDGRSRADRRRGDGERGRVPSGARPSRARTKVKIVGDLTKFDAARLRHLVEKHVSCTGSSLGQRMLDDWRAVLPRFRKVIPVEYRQAMEKLSRHRTDDPGDGKRLARPSTTIARRNKRLWLPVSLARSDKDGTPTR